MNLNELTDLAVKNIQSIVEFSINHTSKQKALVIYDTDYSLTKILTQAYRLVIKDNVDFVDFGTQTKESILNLFENYNQGDLVVLIQSGSFVLNDFRIRLHLFNKGLKVIEHTHLHMNNEMQFETYINSLHYDKEWYQGFGPKLKNTIAQTEVLKLISQHSELYIYDGLEEPKPNLGNYEGMANIGGTFPIGEVFTEAKNFKGMNGTIMIKAFANKKFEVVHCKPFQIVIIEGVIVDYDLYVHPEFVEVIDMIKSHETALIREIGFGVNRSIGFDKPLGDITAFERMCGIHLSVGHKHTVYKKEGIRAHKSRFHVDIFPDIEEVICDGKLIFQDGSYLKVNTEG